MNIRAIRLPLFAIVIIFVGACTTPNDLRSKASAFNGQSSRTAKVVSGCIADKWEAAGYQPSIQVRPSSIGYSLTAASDLGIYGKDTSFVIDIDDTSSGSNARFYSNMARDSSTALLVGIIRNCQN